METFFGALKTLTELHLTCPSFPPYMTLSQFEQLCTECVSLKSFRLEGWRMSEDFLSHVSKLKKLEKLYLHALKTFSNITTFAFEEICTECVYLKTLHFLDGFETSGNSFRGWTSSNMKDLQLDYLSEINLQVR